MNKQRGFFHISTFEKWCFLIVIGAIGYGAFRLIEVGIVWLWQHVRFV